MSDEIGSVGGIELVTAAMARFPDDDGVQFYGCAALDYLWRSAANQEVIRAAGGTQLVEAAVERFPESPTDGSWYVSFTRGAPRSPSRRTCWQGTGRRMEGVRG